MSTSGEDREWRIGELAEATGLTVRTLHHYEHIGLVSPSRTPAGHRIYGPEHVERLYRICALKSLGFPLGQIAAAVQTEELAEVLRRHLDHVDQEVTRLALVRDRLRRLAAYLDEPQVPVERLVALIDAMGHMERHFSPGQLDRLTERRTSLGSAGMRDVAARWRHLGRQLREQLVDGAAPSSRAVQALAALARRYLDDFTGGEPAMHESLRRLREHLPPHGLEGWDRELLDYLDRALDAERSS